MVPLLQPNKHVILDVCPIVMLAVQIQRFVLPLKPIAVRDHHILLGFVRPIEFVLLKIVYVQQKITMGTIVQPFVTLIVLRKKFIAVVRPMRKDANCPIAV